MALRLTTLRTMIQYSVARLRVLCTTRRFWSAVLVSSLLGLAVIGTSAAWRARTSSDETPLAEATFAVSPLAEVALPPTDAPVPHDAPTASSALPMILSTATDTSIVTQSAEAHDRLTTTTSGDEKAQPASPQQVHTTQQGGVMPEGERAMTQRRSASMRAVRQTDASAPQSRPATRAAEPGIPRVQVVSVSSTAVLIQHNGQRLIVRRGARLHGWTLVRLSRTGVTLRRAQQHAFLPLSFGSRFSSNR